MKLTELFAALGEESFRAQLKAISMGTLRTYHLYERIKTRLRLTKLNTESLRATSGRTWARILEHDDDLAFDLSQAILVCQLKMIIDILNFLEVPHEDGFFPKDLDPKQYLTGDWQQRTWDKFKDSYSQPVLLFYLNHLAIEMDPASPLFQPAQ